MQFLKLCDQKPNIDSKFDAVNCETHDASNSVYSRIEAISSPTCDPITMSRLCFQQPLGGSFERRTSSTTMDSLKLLLDQEDNRGRKSKSALRSKMQRIGRSSKTALTKKILRRKSRDDSDLTRITHSLTESLNELTLRYSPTAMMRSSVTDIGGVLKKKVIGSDKLKFERSSSDGAGMAALLVSSMMAAPGLRCIHENHHVVQSHESPSMQSKDSLIVPSPYPSSMLIKASTSNLSSFSVSSISISSSIDAESDDDDYNKNLTKVEPETVSMVVKKVLAQERERTRSYSNDDLEALLSESSEINSLPHYTLGKHSSFHIVRPKPSNQEHTKFLSSRDLDSDADNWIQPGSTVDEPELSAEERESKFHELKENLIGTMHTLHEHIHIPTNELFHHVEDHHHLNDAFQNMLKGQVAIVAADPSVCGPTNTIPHKSFRNRLTSFCKRFRASDSTGDVKTKANLIQTARKHPLIDIPKYDPIPTIQLSQSDYDLKNDQTFYGNNSYGSAIELSSPKETTIRSFMSMPDLSHDLHQLVDLSGLNSIDSLRAGLTSINQRQELIYQKNIIKNTTPPLTTPANKPHHNKAIEKCATNHASISTNPASLLAPLPLFPHRVAEIKQPTSGAPAAPSNGSTQISNVTAAFKLLPISQPLKKDHGHVRAESSGCKIPQNSPLKSSAMGVPSYMTTSVGSSGTAAKEKDSVGRRSSDSDLSVTPKGRF